MNEKHAKKILAFLATQKLAVISSAASANASPEAALIAFAEDDELCIYFQTGEHARKTANLALNPNIALVFGLSLTDLITVQYEGKAEQLVDGEDLAACKQRFITKRSPVTEEYFNHPTAIFFKVSPTWIGYSDYSGSKPDVIEIKDFS